MARITPATSQSIDVDQLEDHEPYKGSLVNVQWSEGSPEYGSEKRLTLDWELESGDRVRDWISLRLGKQQNGTVSKLRQLLNALSDKPSETQVEWFDPETLEWSYVKDGAAFNKLDIGAVVIFRGKIGQRSDGQGRKYTVNVYQAPKKNPAAKGSKLKTEDEVPF